MKSHENRTPILGKIVAVVLTCVITFIVGIFVFAGCYQLAVTGNPASGPAPSLGIVVDKDMRVVYVEKGGAADLGGVKQGDILKKLNKRELTVPAQARKVFNRADVSQKVTLILTRDNKEITLEIQPAPVKGVQGAKTPTPVPPDLMYF